MMRGFQAVLSLAIKERGREARLLFPTSRKTKVWERRKKTFFDLQMKNSWQQTSKFRAKKKKKKKRFFPF